MSKHSKAKKEVIKEPEAGNDQTTDDDNAVSGVEEEQQQTESEASDQLPSEELAVAEPVDIEALQQELAEAQQKARDNLELALRAQAETENIRKRAIRDVERAHKYSLEKLVNELLPVKDSMELGLSASEQADVATLTEGMELTLKMFASALEKCGVEMVDPMGEKFDPERHQAMSMIDSLDAESGTVIDVMQKGYLLNERLIRPAMVVVAK